MQATDHTVFPPPLSTALDALDSARAERGVSRTGAELCAAIEAWFVFIGSVLLAEYLDVGAPDGDLNRLIFRGLESCRPRLIGQWVALGRGCAIALKSEWSAGRVPAWPGLTRLDFGEPDDADHPVTRLIDFRNGFSHGALRQTETTIEAHTRLLDQQMTLLAPDLSVSPIYSVLPDGRRAILSDYPDTDMPSAESEQRAPADLPAMTPFVELPSGERRLLAPALSVMQIDSRFELVPGSLGAMLETKTAQRFAVALERYRQEQRGHVVFTADQVPEANGFDEEDRIPLREALTAAQALTLVQYRPGSGQRTVAGRLLKSLEPQTTVARIWHVIPDHPAISGAMFARALIRWAEMALAEPEGALEAADVSLEDNLEQASKRLLATGKTVGVVVMEAAIGLMPPAGETLSILDVCKLAGTEQSAFRFVLLDIPTAGAELPHDGAVLALPAPARDAIDMEELSAAVKHWATAHADIGHQVLEWVLEGGGASPQTLTDAVEALSARSEQAIFPPAMEHALWTAAPFMQRSQDADQHTTWLPAGGLESGYADALRRLLGSLGH